MNEMACHETNDYHTHNGDFVVHSGGGGDGGAGASAGGGHDDVAAYGDNDDDDGNGDRGDNTKGDVSIVQLCAQNMASFDVSVCKK